MVYFLHWVQRAENFDIWQTNLVNPNFAEFAKFCVDWAKQVTSKDELEGTMKGLFKHNGLGLLEIHTDVSLI